MNAASTPSALVPATPSCPLCNEEVNPGDADSISLAGYPEVAGQCWDCIGEVTASDIRRRVRGMQ